MNQGTCYGLYRSLLHFIIGTIRLFKHQITFSMGIDNNSAEVVSRQVSMKQSEINSKPSVPNIA